MPLDPHDSWGGMADAGRPSTVVESYFETFPPQLLRTQVVGALNGEVNIRLVLESAALSDPRVRVSDDLRALGHEFYRPLVQRWREQNPGIRPTLLPGLQAFILLDTRQSESSPDPKSEHEPAGRAEKKPKSEHEPAGRVEKQRLIHRLVGRFRAPAAEPPADNVTINLLPLTNPGFDWSEGQRILLQIDAIGESARLWIPDPSERRPHLERVYGLAFQLLKAVELESFRRTVEDNNKTPVDDRAYTSTLEVLKSETESAQQQFLRSAEQSAQRVYTQGMLRGGLALLIVCVVLGVCFAGLSVPAVTAIALPAGGIGAAISVFQRMHSGNSIVDFQTSIDRLKMFGALRLMIGGVFGMFVYALIESGLIGPTLTVPAGTGRGLAYVGVVGFLAGFNERLAQDVITSSSRGVSGAMAASYP